MKAVEEFKFSEEIQKVRDELSIKYRENEDLKQRLHLIEQEKLADKLFLQNQIDIQNEQITEMANRFEPVGVEQSIRNNNLTDDEVETILEENLQLKMRLQDAEAQLMDSQSEVDSLNQV